MNTFLETTLAVCGALAAVELLRRLCPEDSAARFAGGLAALYLLASGAAALFSLELDLKSPRAQAQRQQEEFSSYVEGRYQQAAQEDGEAYVRGLLAAAGLSAKELQIKTDRNEEGSIVLTEVAVLCSYPAEEERARALLENALDGEVRVLVEAGG